MTLEVAISDVRPAQCRELVEAFSVARSIPSSSPGCHRPELRRSVETPARYLPLAFPARYRDDSIGSAAAARRS